MDDSGCLLDTNILLRISRQADPIYTAIEEAIAGLMSREIKLFYSLQTVAEFWNAATRPTSQNGHGLAQNEALKLLLAIESMLTLLPENREVYVAWRSLILHHQVKGTKVHDARPVALMQVHGVRSILTLNPSDFRRYADINVIVPTLK